MSDETTMRLGDAELRAETADGYFGPRYEDVVSTVDVPSLLEKVDATATRIAALAASASSVAKSESADTISSLKTKCNTLLSALTTEGK